MLPAIFHTETTALESQIAALQAQIASHTARIALLNDAEFVAGDSLEALKAAIEKVSSLAPNAVSNLRDAVLNLFTGDSNDDGNGNEPQPAPQPGSDRGEEVAIAVEMLTGQSTEWATPFACPLSSAFACSIIEDAPRATLETMPTVADETRPYIELVPVSHSVAYQRRTSDGEIICAYLGGNNKNRLKSWGEWLCLTHSVGSGFELREAKRLDAFKHEIKIWGMDLQQIQRLAETDTTKSPPSRYHIASKPVAEKLLATEVESAPQEIEISEEEIAIANESLQPPAPTPATPKYNPYPMGRRGAAANWEAYQAHKAEARRTAQTAVMEAPQPAPVESKISAGDWVELLANGDRCQVEEVSSQGIYVLTDEGTANVQEDEVKLLLHVPDSWKPF